MKTKYTARRRYRKKRHQTRKKHTCTKGGSGPEWREVKATFKVFLFEYNNNINSLDPKVIHILFVR